MWAEDNLVAEVDSLAVEGGTLVGHWDHKQEELQVKQRYEVKYQSSNTSHVYVCKHIHVNLY